MACSSGPSSASPATTRSRGAEVGAHLTGAVDLAKTASQAWTLGANVYRDNTANRVTNVASGNTLIGVAVHAVGGGAEETIGRVRLIASFWRCRA